MSGDVLKPNGTSRNFRSMLKSNNSKKSDLNFNSEFMSLRDFEAKNIKTCAIPDSASPIFRDQLLLHPMCEQIPYNSKKGGMMDKSTIK
jgi:hypothetical protein